MCQEAAHMCREAAHMCLSTCRLESGRGWRVADSLHTHVRTVAVPASLARPAPQSPLQKNSNVPGGNSRKVC